jgi:hypothetical protein
MKANLKRFFIIGISLLMLLCSPALVKAQFDGDPASPCGDPQNPDEQCPIDSGLLILIAIGAGYGIKKVVDARKISAMKLAENKEI